MFKKFDRTYFSSLENQHRIFVLVGNGFDVSVLSKYQRGRMAGKTTRYDDFFDYITYHKLSDESNVLYKKMKEDREIPGKNNWSDFENSISELYESRLASV